MGISIRAYARRRGVSDTAVRKAIKAGRITKEPDGKIDPVKADAEWARNTDPALQREPTPRTANQDDPPRPLPRPVKPPGSPGPDYQQLRAQKLAQQILLLKHEYAELQRTSIKKAEAEVAIFNGARQEREAWRNFANRHGGAIAAEVGADPRLLIASLERYVTQQLEDLSNEPLLLEETVRSSSRRH